MVTGHTQYPPPVSLLPIQMPPAAMHDLTAAGYFTGGGMAIVSARAGPAEHLPPPSKMAAAGRRHVDWRRQVPGTGIIFLEGLVGLSRGRGSGKKLLVRPAERNEYIAIVRKNRVGQLRPS
jgi:hypothetical protein